MLLYNTGIFICSTLSNISKHFIFNTAALINILIVFNIAIFTKLTWYQSDYHKISSVFTLFIYIKELVTFQIYMVIYVDWYVVTIETISAPLHKGLECLKCMVVNVNRWYTITLINTFWSCFRHHTPCL